MKHSLLVIMGPSGCGKSRIGEVLSAALDIPMIEGDDYHPQINIDKMSSGQPLSDTERKAWLDAIEERLEREFAEQIILACSALTPYVQGRFRSLARWQPRFFLLQAPKELLLLRMRKRKHHFMPLELLDSQCAALSVPHDAHIIDAKQSIDQIVATISELLDNPSDEGTQ